MACFSVGMVWKAKSGPTRVIVGFLWLFCIIIAAVYTGNLVAFLTVPSIPKPVDTLTQLTSQTTYRIGVVGGQALEQILKVCRRRFSLTKALTTLWDPLLCFDNH